MPAMDRVVKNLHEECRHCLCLQNPAAANVDF